MMFFLFIDGGIVREASEVWQAMLDIKNHLGIKIFKDMNKHFKSVSGLMKRKLKYFADAAKVSVLMPDTGAGGFFAGDGAISDVIKFFSQREYRLYLSAVHASKPVCNC